MMHVMMVTLACADVMAAATDNATIYSPGTAAFLAQTQGLIRAWELTSCRDSRRYDDDITCRHEQPQRSQVVQQTCHARQKL